jgi:hypothetical protein
MAKANSNTTVEDHLQDVRELLAELIEVVALGGVVSSTQSTPAQQKRATSRLLEKARI